MRLRYISPVSFHRILSGCVVIVVWAGVLTCVTAMIVSNVVSVRVAVVPIGVSLDCARWILWPGTTSSAAALKMTS